MGIYSNKARGMLLTDQNTTNDLSSVVGKLNFLIAYAGKGDEANLNFKDLILASRKTDLPVLAYIMVKPAVYEGMSFGGDLPTGLNDKHVKMLRDNLHYPSGINLSIDGIILDFSNYLMSDGHTEFTEGWVARVADHLTSQLFQQFRKPVYPIMRDGLYQRYPSTSGPICSLINRWKSISIVTITTGNVLDNGVYIPNDYSGPTVPFISKWDFWWYGAQTFPGMNRAGSTFLFRDSQAALYAELGFVPVGTVTPPPPVDPPPDDPKEPPTDPKDPPTDPQNPGGGTNVNLDIAPLVVQEKRIADALEALVRMFAPLTDRFK
jgi:hypothetical protein